MKFGSANSFSESLSFYPKSTHTISSTSTTACGGFFRHLSSPTVFCIDPLTIDCEIAALVSVAGVVTVRVAELPESI